MRISLPCIAALLVGCAASDTDTPEPSSMYVRLNTYGINAEGNLHCSEGETSEPVSDAGVEKNNWTIAVGHGLALGARRIVPHDMRIDYAFETRPAATPWPLNPVPGIMQTADTAVVRFAGLTDVQFLRGDNGLAADAAHGGLRWTFVRASQPGQFGSDFTVTMDSAAASAACVGGLAGCDFASAGCIATQQNLGTGFMECDIGGNEFRMSPNNMKAWINFKKAGRPQAEKDALLVATWRAVFQHEMGHVLGLEHRGSSQKPFEPPPGGTCTSNCVPFTNPVSCDLMNADVPVFCFAGGNCGTGFTQCSSEPTPNYCARIRLRYFHPGSNTSVTVLDQAHPPDPALPLCSNGNQ